MAAISIALFGSRARGDFERDSDVDILIINDLGQMHTKTLNKINIVFYPYEFLCSRAESGDLFVLHLKQESKVIFDPLSVLSRIYNKFKYKNSYDEDIAFASAIGQLLIQHAFEFSVPNQLNKRIAWCTRTILIARSAELRKPVFSAKGLCDFSGTDAVYELIRNKEEKEYSQKNMELFELFLKSFGSSPFGNAIMTLNEYKTSFITTRNKMGLKVIRNMKIETSGY